MPGPVPLCELRGASSHAKGARFVVESETRLRSPLLRAGFLDDGGARTIPWPTVGTALLFGARLAEQNVIPLRE